LLSNYEKIKEKVFYFANHASNCFVENIVYKLIDILRTVIKQKNETDNPMDCSLFRALGGPFGQRVEYMKENKELFNKYLRGGL
jgi:hypothetical protein